VPLRFLGKGYVMRKTVKAKPRIASKKQPATVAPSANASRLYAMDVFIIEGMLTEDFVDENPEISRTIQIRGDQTLADLHKAIFDAFDRFDAHLYEFQFGKTTHDPKAPRYRPEMPGGFDDGGAAVAERTTIDSRGLAVDRSFGYWFDFGDDWMHQINVVKIEETAPRGKHPKVIKRVGNSPPQYPDLDEE
jgi:Plasmid pRiA4b ORF-3-like protein